MAHVLFIQELLKEFEQTAKGDAGRKIEKKRNAEVKSGKNARLEVLEVLGSACPLPASAVISR